MKDENMLLLGVPLMQWSFQFMEGFKKRFRYGMFTLVLSLLDHVVENFLEF